MTKAIISVTVPQTAGEAAMLLLDQMRTAVLLGHVTVPDQRHHAGINAWLSSADKVLEAKDR